MTDREKLLFALLSEDDAECDGRVTVLQVTVMLVELGEEYRRLAHTGTVLAGV